MELTEISGKIELTFNDFIFDLSVSSEVRHTALLDSDTELNFNNSCSQYIKLLDTAVRLYKSQKPFELRFSVFGNDLSDPPYTEPRSLYYCHVQHWTKHHNHLAVELALPGQKELIRMECPSSEISLYKAIYFAFGGFVFTCLDFKIKEINFSDPDISDALELYCLADDKQFLLNELFNCDYVFLPFMINTKKE